MGWGRQLLQMQVRVWCFQQKGKVKKYTSVCQIKIKWAEAVTTFIVEKQKYLNWVVFLFFSMSKHALGVYRWARLLEYKDLIVFSYPFGFQGTPIRILISEPPLFLYPTLYFAVKSTLKLSVDCSCIKNLHQCMQYCWYCKVNNCSIYVWCWWIWLRWLLRVVYVMSWMLMFKSTFNSPHLL